MFGEMLFADTLYADSDFLNVTGWIVHCNKNIDWTRESINPNLFIEASNSVSQWSSPSVAVDTYSEIPIKISQWVDEEIKEEQVRKCK